YFGIMLLLSLCLAAHQLRQVRRHQRTIRAGASNPRVRKFLVYFVWTIVFAVALTLTRSRAGILSSFAAITVFIGAYVSVTMMPRGRSGHFKYLAAVASVATLILLFALLFRRVAMRIQTEGLIDTGRLCTYESTWRAIQDHFWLGTGLGSFQDVFPAYRTPEC